MLAHYVGASGGRGAWHPWFAFADGVVWPSVPRLGTTVVTRGAVTQRADALRAMVGGFAASLGLAASDVAGLLAEAEARASSVGEGLELKPGDLVVFTGMSEARKARECGIPVVGDGVLS